MKKELLYKAFSMSFSKKPILDKNKVKIYD